MLTQKDILSTIEMIDQQHLDIRTITMGISIRIQREEIFNAMHRI